MRVFLGMITKRLDESDGLLKFIKNAQKHGHNITEAVVACSNGFDGKTYSAINEMVPLSIIDTNNPAFLREQFAAHGVSEAAAQTLLRPPFKHENGMLPYGFNRNLVLMYAILKNADVLIFIDSDVIPHVLVQDGDSYALPEIDFFSRHLDNLTGDTLVTISEYSGYNILPPAQFEGMDSLLHGLQKADMTDYWKTSDRHHCLALHEPHESPEPGNKVLGGNVGFRMEAFAKLPPFFSSYYTADDIYLARGEDTVLSAALKPNGIGCLDIKTKIFHDTYMNYPNAPDLRCDSKAQDRFYYACTGWIGRNPFLNYILGNDLPAVRDFQREHLRVGMQALGDYTGNPRYLTLLDKFDISWNSLDRYIGEYNHLLDVWAEFMAKCAASSRSAPGMSLPV